MEGKRTKTLGIIGGMGPKATAVLYDLVVDHTDAACDQDHISTVILSDCSIPDRTLAIESGDTAPVIAALTGAASRLEACGADVIIMPCNTAHYFLEDIRAAAGCEVLDMIGLAVRDAISRCDTDSPAIGVMATDGTLLSGVYEREIVKQGGRFVRPSDEAQAGVMSLIYDDIKSGKKPDEDKFNAAASELSESCDVIILACTELSVYKELCPVPPVCMDAMDSLVREAVLSCGAAYKE